jgi:hypothetical protein
MADAKMVNGKALVGYIGGVGVDSEGVAIPGAPKQPKNSSPARRVLRHPRSVWRSPSRRRS